MKYFPYFLLKLTVGSLYTAIPPRKEKNEPIPNVANEIIKDPIVIFNKVFIAKSKTNNTPEVKK